VLVWSAAVALTASAAVAQPQARPRPPAAAAALSSALEATAGSVGPAVVEIFTTAFTPADGLLPRTAHLVNTERASGSGVIVDPDGFIVTNAHVVRGAQRLRVEIMVAADGQSILARHTRSVMGQVVGVDLETDLAVVRIDEK